MPGHGVALTVTSQRRPSARRRGGRRRRSSTPAATSDDPPSTAGSDAQRVGVPQPGREADRQLRHLSGRRPGGPPATARRLDLANRGGLQDRQRARDVQPAVDVARRQYEGSRGEAVTTQVRALPDVRLAGARDRPGERAAVDGTTAVAAAVRADQQHRVRHGLARQRGARRRKGELGQLRRVDDAQDGDPRCGRGSVGEEDPGRAVGGTAAGRGGPAPAASRPATARSKKARTASSRCARDVVRPGAPVLHAYPAGRDGSGAGRGVRRARGRGLRTTAGLPHPPGSLAQARLTPRGRMIASRRAARFSCTPTGNRRHETLPKHIALR